MRTLITGATGFVGHHLLKRLGQGNVLSRNAEKARQTFAGRDVQAFSWNLMSETAPAEAFADVDTVIHLAGESVAQGRWTARKKQAIRESRVVGTRNLVDGIERLERRPKALICASAVGIYGSRGDEILDEQAEPADDYLAEVCSAWEQEAARAEELGVRVVSLRTGIVLGSGGGALSKMLTPFKLCVGGRLGNGHQWMPWVHVDDLVGLMLFAAENEQIRGPMNGVAPNPVTNREFTKTFASVLGRPAICPAPGFALRITLGEFAQVLLGSQRAVPKVAMDHGYEFQFPELRQALSSILCRTSTAVA